MRVRVVWVLAAILISGCGILSGCATHGERPPPQVRGPADIPPGQMPPPGLCRVWIPGHPPGHQPPPGDCSRLRHEVPRGAILVEG